jgi:hypothetical protein
MSNQIPRRPIKVYALEVVEILFLEIKDLPTDYPGMDAIAVEDVSVHGWPPLRFTRPKGAPTSCSCGSSIAREFRLSRWP